MISITNPYVLLGGVCGAALIFATGFGLGHHAKTLEDAQAALSAAKKTVAVVSKQAAATSTVDQQATKVADQIQTKTITLVKEVPRYVTPKADAACVVPVGAVSLLDSAANGSVPSAPIGLQDAPSGVALSELISDDVANAGAFQTAIARLKAWDEWYGTQEAIAAGK